MRRIYQFIKESVKIIQEDRKQQKYLREHGLQAYLDKYRTKR